MYDFIPNDFNAELIIIIVMTWVLVQLKQLKRQAEILNRQSD